MVNGKKYGKKLELTQRWDVLNILTVDEWLRVLCEGGLALHLPHGARSCFATELPLALIK